MFDEKGKKTKMGHRKIISTLEKDKEQTGDDGKMLMCLSTCNFEITSFNTAFQSIWTQFSHL